MVDKDGISYTKTLGTEMPWGLFPYLVYHKLHGRRDRSHNFDNYQNQYKRVPQIALRPTAFLVLSLTQIGFELGP